MKEIHRQILAALGGGMVLAGLYLFGNFYFLFSLLISAGIGLGTYFSIPRKKEDNEIEMAPGVTRADFALAMEKIQDGICRFDRLSKINSGKEAGTMIGEIVQTLKQIKDLFETDPGDVARVGSFLDRYIPRAYDISKQYAWLSSMPLKGEDQQVLDSARSAMERIRNGFIAVHRQCLENDLAELEVNSELLQEIMEMDLPTLDTSERRSS